MEYFLRLFPILLTGAGTTIGLFFIVILLSLPLGYLMTLMATSKIPPLRWLTNALIYVLRGTPLMLQLFFFYFGLPFIPVIGPYLRFPAFTVACIAYVINYAAYFAEIYRGGLLSIDPGQYEAAQVLGLGKLQTMLRITIPQMIRVVLPSITNESITLVKDTSLLYAIALPEILHYAKSMVMTSGNPMAFLVAAIIYLVMNTVLTLFFKLLEKKLAY